jgi:5-hydroxyisourate hydrolase
MGRLTTHVLDTMTGAPAAKLCIELWTAEDENWRHLYTVITNADGRVDGALLDGESMLAGQYELRFHAGAYLRANGTLLPEPAFLDIVPIRFGIADTSAHYHVPLLLSAYGYSTYRGS